MYFLRINFTIVVPNGIAFRQIELIQSNNSKQRINVDNDACNFRLDFQMENAI